MVRLLSGVFRFLGSFGLAVGTLLAMLGLTYISTMAQRTADPYTVQTRMFESFFFDIKLFGKIPFFLPGGLLLLSILFVNLLVGGMIRLRRTWSRVGVMVIHVGIATLLLGNFIEYLGATKGHMAIFEGETKDEFESYFEWEVAIFEPMQDGTERAHIIPGDRFMDLGSMQTAKFDSAAIPFTLELSGFVLHCQPDQRMGRTGKPELTLRPLEQPKETERCRAGIGATLVQPDGNRQKTVLWYSTERPVPWVVQAGGRSWGIVIRKRTFLLPFEVELKDFQREDHPGTGMSKRFSSDVVRHEGHIAEDVHIAMNEPMRSAGYTFYQSQYGQRGESGAVRVFSDFSVVLNPSDQVPLYACIVIGFGLLIQFSLKLYGYIRVQWGVRRETA
jgi:hypothetical protein